ncbi:MAG: hypothetical protein KAS94_11980 [Desulfobulbaceae bacterium]|nr:hypothetical protein [Desulfobulbaceae bacterium]
MRSTNDLWGEIGELAENEVLHVITQLFTAYEVELQGDPANEEALKFFRNLDNAITLTCECNSNRR